MEPRKIVRLMDLPLKDRLPKMAEGLESLARNVESKNADAILLFKAGRYASAHLLDGLASEEAAKALMLLDAVRIGWKPDPEVRRLLNVSFYDHHSRLVYAHIYDLPAHLENDEIEEFVAAERDAYFVDGPEGFDWVLRNMKLAKREGLMQVDYCVDAEGQGEWSDPDKWGWPPLLEGAGIAPRGVVELVESLSRVGVLSIDGLKAILKAWQGAPVSIGWRDVRGLNWTTLKILEEAGAVCEHTEQDVTRIVNQWHMPLVGIELAENKKMTLAQAYKRRDALFEAFMAREYGDPYE